MKKIALFIVVGFLFISCKSDLPNQFEIQGTAKGYKNGEKIFLEREQEMELEIIDTAIIEDGKFVFEGSQSEPEIHFVSIENQDGKLPVIIEQGEIILEINKNDLDKSIIKGTYNNDELYGFRTRGNTRIKAEMKAFERNNNEKMIAAQRNNDTAVIYKLQQVYQSFVDRIEKYNNDYIDKNPSSYVSVLLLEDMMYNPTASIKKLKQQYEKLSSDLKNTKKGLALKKHLEKLTVIEVGMEAPDFKAPNPQGKAVSLKESLGKLTLLEFWASWCKPCRQENPYIVAMYNDFHSKGLNIVSVSLDESLDQWVKGIADDDLRWVHVSNLKSWQEPIANLYNVKSIPSTFLIDEKGIIIAKDLRQEDLRTKIAEILK
jgi:peroxiredoxin